MCRISVNGLRLTAHHGVLDQERRVGNEFELNIWVDAPCAQQAMLTDNIDDTINYALIVDIAKREMAKPSKLIESVAGRILQALASAFEGKIQAAGVSIAKLAPPIPAQLSSVAFYAEWHNTDRK